MVNITETDYEFLAQANSVVGSETYTAGSIQKVNEIRARGLGKPVYSIFDQKVDPNPENPTLKKPYEHKILICEIMPLNEDNTRHLVVFITGAMVIIEPIDETTKKLYKDQMDLNSGWDSFKNVINMEKVEHNAFNNERLGSKIVARSSNPGDVEIMKGVFATAIEIAAKSNVTQIGVESSLEGDKTLKLGQTREPDDIPYGPEE